MPRIKQRLKPIDSELLGPVNPVLKIAIVGCYPGSWEAAPFDKTEWEIWGFSRRNMGKLPRVNRWFELHEQKHFLRYENEIPGYTEYLSKDFVVLQDAFPRDDLLERFGPYFFSQGQAPWLMAYAISQNPMEIGLWGIEALDIYDRQRFEIQHFVQVAKDLGIMVTVPDGCTLLQPRKLYGFPPALAK